MEHLPLPFQRRRQLERSRFARLREAAQGATAPDVQHVRLLPGRLRLRLRQLHQRPARAPAESREGADQPGEFEGRYLRFDQDVLWEGALMARNGDAKSKKRGLKKPTS